MTEYSFARQPILDRSLKLYAYEFLYRPTATHAKISHSLTSDVLSSLIIDLGLKEASNNRFAFINMSYDDIMGKHIEALPTDKFILELLEDIQPDEKLNKRVQTLVDMGFSFALDDFVYAPEWDPLIDLADIIKLDLTLTTLEENKLLINKLKPKGIKFLAEKVETHQQYNDYLNIGCDFFQGYFFCKPEKISGKALNSSNLARTKIISDLNIPDITVEELEKTFQQHPRLTYNLLKYLNSAYFSFPNPVETIKQAVLMLGLNGIKKWSTILCLREYSSKPSELRRQTLVRAKLAELLAINNGFTDPNKYFLMGLLSSFDALMDNTMETILQTMFIDESIVNTLTNKPSEINLKQIYDTIIQHETDGCSKNARANSSYVEAYQWADQVINNI